MKKGEILILTRLVRGTHPGEKNHPPGTAFKFEGAVENLGRLLINGKLEDGTQITVFPDEVKEETG